VIPRPFPRRAAIEAIYFLLLETNDGGCRSALRSAPETASENAKRWQAMSVELSSDPEQLEKRRSTAKPRCREAEHLESSLVEG
jgi:hypothetical protein